MVLRSEKKSKIFSKMMSVFEAKSCCREVRGPNLERTLKIEYTFIRYVPCVEGNLKPCL